MPRPPVAAIKPVRVIDVTPTWRAILPILLMGYENANAEGRQIALEELQRMADLADRCVAENPAE